MPSGEITGQQRAFLKLYLGRDDRFHGNGTRSYMKAFDVTNQRSAQVSASRLLKKPHIKAVVDEAMARALDEHAADAAFVLKQSLLLFDRSMGNEAVEVDVIDQVIAKDPETGEKTLQHRLKTLETREYNPTIAHKALELIGRHTSVQAFQDNVEHTHTHTLIEKLNARAKLVEARALRQQQSLASDPAVIEGKAMPVDDEAGAPVGIEKEGASGGGQPGAHRDRPGETPLSATGATGK